MRNQYMRRLSEKVKVDVSMLKYIIDRRKDLSYLSRKYFDKVRIETEFKSKEKNITCLIENYNNALENTIVYDKLNLWNKIIKLI